MMVKAGFGWRLVFTSQLFWALSALSFASLAAQDTTLDQSENEQLARQLRERRLFSLSQSHCRLELESQEITPREKAFLTVELIRSYVDQAYQSNPGQRTTLLESARKVAKEFLEQNRQHPFRRLIEVQDALTSLASGILFRQEIEAGEAAAGLNPAFETAFNYLRQGTRQLEKLKEQLSDDILQTGEKIPLDQGLNRLQTIALQNHVRFQLARGHINRAMLYGRMPEIESDNRLDALQRASETHNELLRQVDDDQPLWWDVQLDRLKVARLLKDDETIHEINLKLTADEVRLTPTVLTRLRTEMLYYEIERGRAEAGMHIIELQERAGETSPEFQLAKIEAMLWFAADEPDEEKRSDLQKRCVAIVKQLEQSYGSYWSRRGNLLLIKSADSSPGTVDLQVLIRVADASYVKGELDNAIKSYDAAAKKAEQFGDAKQQFDFSYKSALIEHRRKNYLEAFDRLKKLSKDHPSDPRAAQAHLIAVVDTAELAKKAPELIDGYVHMLREQIELWPDQPPTDQARIWYSAILARQRQPLEAIKTLLEIEFDSPLFVTAIRSATEQTTSVLDRGDVDPNTRNKFVLWYAAIFNESFTNDRDEMSNRRWWAMTLSATVLYRVGITIDNNQLQRLQALVDQSDSAPEELLIATNRLLALEYATGSIQSDRFVQSISDVIKQSPESGLSVLQQVLQSDSLDASIAKKLPEVVTQLNHQKESLSKQSRSILLTLDAKTAAASGNDQRAIRLFEELIKSQPRNLAIRLEFAKLLGRSRHPAQLKRALQQWRTIANVTKPRSSEWFLAKYNVVLALINNGEPEKARQLLVYLKEIPPGWDKSSLQDQFEALLEELK